MTRQMTSTFRGSPRNVEVARTVDGLRPRIGEVLSFTVRTPDGLRHYGAQLDAVGLAGCYVLHTDILGRVTRDGSWVALVDLVDVRAHREVVR